MNKGNGSVALLHESITDVVIGSAIAVHKALGPGLLESVYETCLAHELQSRGMKFLRQVDLPVVYDGKKLDSGFRLDLLVNDQVVVEIKSVEKLMNIHEAQLLTYLRLSGKRVGLLINFNVTKIKDGMLRRIL